MRAGATRARSAWQAVLAVVLVGQLGVSVGVLADRSHSDRANAGSVVVAGGNLAEGAVVQREAGRRTAAEARRTAALEARTAAVQTLLARRSDAVRRHDPIAFLATVDTRQPGLAARQQAYLANLSRVPLGSWTYRLIDGADPDASTSRDRRYGDPTYRPGVELDYRISGYDDHPTPLREVFTFVQRGGRWLLADDGSEGAPGSATQHSERALWDYGPVVVVPGAHTIVLGHPGSETTMRQLSAEAEADIPAVSAVWGRDWPQRAVLLVPGSQGELEGLLDTAQDQSRIAAVATVELPRTTSARPSPVGDRIAINPVPFAALSPLGRTVVVTHELTHLAARQHTGIGMPSWLVEGLADEVGFQRVNLPLPEVAAELADDVRAGRAPTALPTNADFSPANPRLAQAYEEAWLACRQIVADGGPAALVQVYREVGDAGPGNYDHALDTSLRAHIHRSTDELVAEWRQAVRAQLS